MIFNNYFIPVDGGHDAKVARPQSTERGGPLPGNEVDARALEDPIIPLGSIGSSVTEGSRFGNFIQSTQQAIRMGAGRLELAGQMGGGNEAVGFENYGKDARQELRDIMRVNEVKIHSIHTPSNIGNMSGFNPQERGFNEEYRKTEIEEVKKAIEFAADVTQGGSVVIHTGEFMRDMTRSKWNSKLADGDFEFKSYEEEPERQVLYMVDDRSGKLISEVRKSQIIYEPEFKQKWDTKKGRMAWIDEEGNFIDDETDPDALFKRVPIWDAKNYRFKSNRMTWDDFEKRASDWNKNFKRGQVDAFGNKKFKDWTPEEVFFKSQMDTRILQARGSSLYHGRSYSKEEESLKELEKSLKFFQEIEDNVPEKEQWKLLKEIPSVQSHHAGQLATHMSGTEYKKPTEILKESINEVKLQMRYIHEASASADAQAKDSEETMRHVKPVEEYAQEQTSKSYAEVGIYAMDETQAKKLDTPIFLAPENIFPEMGFGSHPDELIDLVKGARKKMVEYLTEPYIRDPQMGFDENGNPKLAKNPYYRGLGKKDAEKKAESHIKATLDTQHLGMWWKNFQPQPGETVDQREKRFNEWYMKQVQKLSDSGVLGNIHVVDGMGGGHVHLPAGQGKFPVVDAVKLLKKQGFTGNMTSEGHGESAMGAARQLTETWRAFGSTMGSYGFGGGGGFGASTSWTDVNQSYFGATQSPYFIYGNFAPSNDWSLWSQVPME